MTNKVITIESQSLMDVAIQEYGTADVLVALAFINNVSITHMPSPGDKILIPEDIYGIPEIVAEYKRKDYYPACFKKIHLGAFSNGFSNGFN